jgi:hypothetical protein
VDFILPIAGIALEIERIALAARGSRANSDLKALAASVGGLKRNAWSRPVVRHLPGEESPGSPLIAVRRV